MLHRGYLHERDSRTVNVQAGLQPPSDCNIFVVHDVFKATNAGAIDFNFYEKCATLMPNLRETLKFLVDYLPREVVLDCWMQRDRLVMRQLKFTAAEPNGEYCTMQRPPQTLKRYGVESLYLVFGEIYGFFFLVFLF